MRGRPNANQIEFSIRERPQSRRRFAEQRPDAKRVRYAADCVQPAKAGLALFVAAILIARRIESKFGVLYSATAPYPTEQKDEMDA